ncbi:MAG TPA: lysylphosphatidylglycerol synthase transmembrane domain-containing protein, partial [Acidimicrobiia bacterium]|nr:lysylphosphatidylglycerol synthase transmembrane domain-containing protein [Acidimicrobiia bacterium]
AALVGEERALAAAQRALGNEGLAELLPMFESQALSPAARRAVPGLKKLLKSLREAGATLTGEEAPMLAELRRVSPGDVLMAAATFLGFYLIVEQFAGIDLWATLQTADVAWVLVAFLISPIPQFTSTISLKGAVAAPLPYGPVLGEQFANNFTGLIGGTLANTALVIRFFQKQGLTVAVAASSGVLNSLASGMIQVLLVIVGIIITSGDYDTGTTGSGSSSGLEQLVILGIILFGVALTIGLVVPKLRRLVMGTVKPQLQSAKDNLKGILSTPRKAAMLFGGNLASQILFALVLDASLHAYGYSLPLMQLIVINSLASVLGGMAPVPGGMGVVEAGLIAGLTAAGIPTEAATATVFTHRLFTAYLPPVYGWFALQWLRRNDYI